MTENGRYVVYALRSKAGDIITEYDGRKVERVSDLPRAVAGAPVGRDVRFA
jgi:S1-C subfamily serine protease